MGIADYQKKSTGNGSRAGSSNLGGAAIEVIESQKVDGTPHILGKLLFDSIGRKAGEEIVVRYNSDTAAKIEENLKRGMGSGKGSILVLENVLNAINQEENVVVARWITTAKSAAKATDTTTGHHLRSVESVMLATPSVSFLNPTQQKGEPKYINFALTAKTAYLRGDGTQGKVYDREFLEGKLRQVADLKNVRVNALALAPESAFLAATLDDAVAAVIEMTDINNGVALVRIIDETNEVAVAQIRRPYDVTKEVFVTKLKEGNLIRAIPNAAIAEEVSKGNWKLEVIQGVDIPFLGDTRGRIVDELSKKTLDELTNYKITYGDDSSNRVVDAVIVTMETTDGKGVFFCHDPVRLEGKRSSLAYLQTPHFDLVEPPKQAAAAAAEQEAPEANASSENFSAGSENFNAEDFDFVSAGGETPEQTTTTQSTSRNRRVN